MKPPTSARPHLIIMVGIPGAGKSTFADRFATTFQAPLVSADHFQKKLFGTDRGQGREEIAARAAEVALQEVIKTKQTIVYDVFIRDTDHRQELIRMAKKQGYQPLVVWVQTESSEAERRATKGKAMSSKKFRDAVTAFEPPHAKEKAIVISGRHAYVNQLKIVLRSIAGPVESKKPLSRPKTTRSTGSR